MQFEDSRKTIKDPSILSDGFMFCDGYVFEANRYPANVFDAIVIRNPPNAQHWGGKKICSEHSLCEHIAYINTHRIDKATVIANDISFLRDCPTLKHVTIIPSDDAGDNFDFAPLYEHPRVLSLRCQTEYGKFLENCSEIDLSFVRGLEDVHISSQRFKNYQSIPTLKTLRIDMCQEKDVEALFLGTELDSLALNSGKICSLKGLEKARKMQCLQLINDRLIQDISHLADTAETLKELSIQNCPRIKDYSVLQKLTNLVYLCLEGSAKLPNLDFLDCMPKLKTLILGMEVENGDLNPCRRLSYVYCSRMHRYYNIKVNDLPRVDYLRGNEDIEPWRRII